MAPFPGRLGLKSAAGRLPALIAILVLIVLALQLPPVARGIMAALAIADIQAGAGPSLLKRFSPVPERQAVDYAVAGRRHAGDLYLPADEVRAGIVLVPGAHPAGKDDPRLVQLAGTLARVHFAVLIPDIPGLRQLRVRASDVREIADAFNYMSGRHELAPAGRAGLGAFSYAVGPVILAALEADIHDRVQFIFSMGGYHDLSRVVTFFTTGYFRHDGRWRHLEPNRYGMWVFALSNLGLLSEAHDRRLFAAMAERKLKDETAMIDDLARDLGPEGKRLYALLANADPERTPALIAALPPLMRALIDALNLADKDLSHLSARCILVHSRGDRIIPYTESLALAQALPQGRVRSFIIGEATHVDVEQLGWQDRLRLWQAMGALLAEQQLAGD